ncbi:hypothetical protein H257_06801 [Aphanomyces astaci]|uniref:Uncharacterized protein n=1 Tax=Aphanomyces astaci TaxID=112090 RepID=W4GMI3_APHAT|nr:hypothetical protein H257_06801 [Aphanomyces astaci]ETV80546.1 hypothetical protein H257_06801 [Aphanomyces astaci]|eukprot:XP_009830470.1 hypothetical protein H257_06801 [Aphanomyces astaci]
MDALSPPTTWTCETNSDDMEVQIHDLTSPVAEMRDFGLNSFSATRDAASTDPASPPMVREYATSPGPMVPVDVPRHLKRHSNGATACLEPPPRALQPLLAIWAYPPATPSALVMREVIYRPKPRYLLVLVTLDRLKTSIHARSNGSAASATTATSPPSTDPWTAFAAKRVEATKASQTKDVGTYRPSMADLKPLLAKHSAGTLSFHDTLPIQKHDKREVVGWLHMATGNHTKAINEDICRHGVAAARQPVVGQG